MARTTERIPRRTIDRLEDAVSWILMVAVLAVILGAGLVGIEVHGNVVERSEAEQATRTPVIAVLLEDAIVQAQREQTHQHGYDIANILLRHCWRTGHQARQ